MAKSQKVTGVVVDENGKPIPITTIGVINKNIGTYSLEDGSFELDLTGIESLDCIVFRHIGYKERCIQPSHISVRVIPEATTKQLADFTVKPGKSKRIGARKTPIYNRVQIRTPFNGAERQH